MPDTKPDSELEPLLDKALALTADQREWLANRLIDSLAQDPDYYPDWHREAVQEAVKAYEADPGSAISLEEHKRRTMEALEEIRAGRR